MAKKNNMSGLYECQKRPKKQSTHCVDGFLGIWGRRTRFPPCFSRSFELIMPVYTTLFTGSKTIYVKIGIYFIDPII